MERLELLFGKAAVVGFLSLFGRKHEYEIEINPHTGHETLWSVISRRQRELKSK